MAETRLPSLFPSLAPCALVSLCSVRPRGSEFSPVSELLALARLLPMPYPSSPGWQPSRGLTEGTAANQYLGVFFSIPVNQQVSLSLRLDGESGGKGSISNPVKIFLVPRTGVKTLKMQRSTSDVPILHGLLCWQHAAPKLLSDSHFIFSSSNNLSSLRGWGK